MTESKTETKTETQTKVEELLKDGDKKPAEVKGDVEESEKSESPLDLKKLLEPVAESIAELSGRCDGYKDQIAKLEGNQITEDFFSSNSEVIEVQAGKTKSLYGPWCVQAGQTIDL